MALKPRPYPLSPGRTTAKWRDLPEREVPLRMGVEGPGDLRRGPVGRLPDSCDVALPELFEFG